MKTINKYRTTNKFCIMASDIENLALISKKFGRDLCAVAKCTENNIEDQYTVRTTDSTQITDHVVTVRFGDVHINETKVINNFAETEAILERLGLS